MFDANYFNTNLSQHIAAAGDKAMVEIHLLNARTHRVRSVIEAGPAYVVLDGYRHRVDGGRNDQHWQAKPSADEASTEMVRVVLAYESIVEIVITPAEDSAAPRIGFVRS